MTGDAESASSIFESLSFLLTGYRRITFASYGLRTSRIASKLVTSESSQKSYLSGAYRTHAGDKLWIITESDRSVTIAARRVLNPKESEKRRL